MNKTVTAIITTFNRANIVTDAIQSALAQSHPVSELIVIDDGSTDNTASTVKQAFSKTAIPTRYIFKPNGGMATSLNKGLEEAKYEWVAFLDDDDLWSSTHIEKSLEILEKNAKSDCIISLREEKGKTQTPPSHLLSPYKTNPLDNSILIYKKKPLTTPFFTSTVGTCVIKKALASALLFDIDAGARLDIHFFWRASEYSDIILDMNSHGSGRQFRTSYLSTDVDAPQEIKDRITLRRNADEIRMLSKLIKDRKPENIQTFNKMLQQAIIGRVYLNRKMGNFKIAQQYLVQSWKLIPFNIAIKELVFCFFKRK